MVMTDPGYRQAMGPDAPRRGYNPGIYHLYTRVYPSRVYTTLYTPGIPTLYICLPTYPPRVHPPCYPTSYTQAHCTAVCLGGVRRSPGLRSEERPGWESFRRFGAPKV